MNRSQDENYTTEVKPRRLEKTISFFFYPLIFILALLLIFEEWLWGKLLLLTSQMGQWPIIRQTEAKLRQLPKYAALSAIAIPWLLLLPVKFVAVKLVTHHHQFLGLLVLLSAKVIGTAIVARVFSLTRDEALKIIWFKKLYDLILALLHWARNWLQNSTSYKFAHSQIQKIKLRWRQRRATLLGTFFRLQVRRKKNSFKK